VTADSTPVEIRRWQLTDLDGNNNKFWEFSRKPGDSWVTVRWGRVGSEGQSKDFSYSYALGKIPEKERKGYREVLLHQPKAVMTPAAAEAVSSHPKVTSFVADMFLEAGEHIQTYLNGNVDALSQEQIAKGRSLLTSIKSAHQNALQSNTAINQQLLQQAVQKYYNIIPTKLPRKIDKDQVVRDFCADFYEQEQRLDQLEAGLATITVAGQSQVVSLGCDIDVMDTADPRFEQIKRYVEQTTVHHYGVKVTSVFVVRIPQERAAWEADTRGKDNVTTLFHGTRFYNVRHIVKGGLRVPTSAANGWNFGRGIYFARKSSKSINYCSANRVRYTTLLLSDVALGRQYIPHDTGSWTQAPSGYDSVWGKAGYSGRLRFDEYIVYTPSQQTLRFLVTLTR